MKIMKSIILILAVGLLTSGCYYSHPLKGRQTSAFNGTTVAAGTIGAAGGAFAGNAINKDVGAPIGAAVGALAGGGTAYVLQDRKAREIQEARAAVQTAEKILAEAQQIGLWQPKPTIPEVIPA